MIYTIKNYGLYDRHDRRIAIKRGSGIYDDNNRRVATMLGNYLFDSNDRKMMEVRGDYIFDAGNKRVALLSDAEKAIKGAEREMLSAALWYCFVR